MVENGFLLSKAHGLAQEAHEGQFRAEGLPYFTHCVEVARILHEEWEINDENMLCAAILHDVVEDTDVSLDEIKTSFGEDIAKLVDGVSKFRSENGDETSDREMVRKVFDRTLIDPRVAVLKIADRLHNMRTLESMPQKKQLAKSRETLSVYSKLAESLGMWVVMKELEDLSFKYLNNVEYKKWKQRLENDPRNSDLFISHVVSSLEAIVRDGDVSVKVEVRKNTIWQLRKKSERIPRFEDNNDAVSFRVVVEDKEGLLEAKDSCYKLLGRFREAYSKEENYDRFRDYYVRSKDNKYSAIQMTVNTPNGAIEIAITSSSKEDFNNWGVVSLLRKGQKELSSEYALKLVFTPAGQVKFFPKEATGVDFAYSISPRLGAQATGLLIDKKEFPLSTIIPNGSVIEIVAGEDRIAPERSIRDYCLPSIKKVIDEQLANVDKEIRIVKGKQVVERVLKERGLLNLVDLFSFEEHRLKVINLLYHLGCKGSLDNLYYLTGSGLVSVGDFSRELDLIGITKEKLSLTSIRIEGLDEPGILEMVGAFVKQIGGNVGAIDLGRNTREGKKIFFLRLVVENLNKRSEKLFDKFLHEDPRVKEVLIV